MIEATTLNEFKSLLSQSDPKNMTPYQWQELAAFVFAQTNNFTLLHGMSIAYAMGFLLAYLPDSTLANIYVWQNLLAASMSCGRTSVSLDFSVPTAKLEWSEILARAIANEDDHVIKASYAAHQMYKLKNNKLFHYCAELKVTCENNPADQGQC